MTDRREIAFTPAKRDQLRKAYDAAKAAGQDQFDFEGIELLVSYARYLLEYLDTQFQRRGL
jgi:hypothetical protein